jgi:hypothetical protein
MDKRRKIAGDIGVKAGLPDQSRRDGGIPPDRREDDSALG